MNKTILLSLLLAIGSAQAALIDKGTFTADDVSGLDWLDLTATASLTPTEALLANSGWRYATNDEVENLFSIAYDGFYATNATGTSVWDENPYSDQLSDIAAFQALFGANITSPDYWSAGYYLDEDSIWRIMGNAMTPGVRHFVYGPEHTIEYSSLTKSPSLGTYLVRTSAIPVPPAVWLFGSGLGLLGWARGKQVG